MIAAEHIARDINRRIEHWRKEHRRLIVAIDGYSGSGKTTVLDWLASQNSNILPVHLDEFIRHWRQRKKMMDAAADRSRVFEYKWYRYRELMILLRTFKEGRRAHIALRTYDFEINDFGNEKTFDLTKPILVIEGIFLFHPRLVISKMLDNGVYLDVDFDTGDKRRVLREKKKWGRKYVAEKHPDSYVVPFKSAYRRYVDRFNPAGISDVVYRVS